MLVALRLTFWLAYLGVASLLSPIALQANESLPSTELPLFENPVKLSLLHEETSIQPGRPFWVAVQLEMEENWHTYWKNPGDAGMPVMLEWEVPEGVTVGPLMWPTPQRFSVASAEGFGYEGKVIFLAELIPAASYTDSEAVITVNARWVVCSDTTCLPGDGKQTIRLLAKSEEPQKLEKEHALFNQARSKLPKKHEGITAQRKNQLVEILFRDSSQSPGIIRHAEFFPEKKKTIKSTSSSLSQFSSLSNAYILVMQEVSSQDSIKGVLVVHTDNGEKAYEVDTPILEEGANGQDVTMASAEHTGKSSQEQSPLKDEIIKSSFEFEGGVSFALILAFVGGMILNLMPCVLPVISFKVLGFIKLAGQSRKLIFQHGVAFSFGVLLSFWALAALLLILQAYGRSVGWGFQLQEPLFVAVLAAGLFIFGLSLFGVFELGTSLMSAAGEAQQKASHRNELLSSFISGILATAVATPCTGPFLGSAVGFAVTLPPLQSMAIFTAVGLGMSFPYLALARFPVLLKYLPKPGPWMVTFKELMGFLMMASVVWLIWVFSAQTSSLSVSLLLAGLFLFACAGWIYGKWASPLCKRWVRNVGTAFAVMFFAMGSYIMFMSTSSWAESVGGSSASSHSEEIADVWEEFSPERVAELRAKGIPVFVDFTAKWCLICQTNHLVLSGDDLSKAFDQRGVVRMKADWTKRDEVIAAELRKFGRNSVPLYILYDGEPESDPQILPQVLTPDTVMESLEQL